ncbi:hypothetical protein SELMODRAFT_428858 [Selaginella moellendorffii]|uniref:Uncharacterized protein n=1 Tax=Selaginella moellendorffii TaxID=88036 RepID=D8T485_SELML|nr:hypothetical protein SELMODRAFT_428858 [Selaginella moellendorffii]
MRAIQPIAAGTGNPLVIALPLASARNFVGVAAGSDSGRRCFSCCIVDSVQKLARPPDRLGKRNLLSQSAGCVADRVTLLATLKTCSTLTAAEALGTAEKEKLVRFRHKCLEIGARIHSQAGTLDLALANSLIDLYAESLRESGLVASLVQHAQGHRSVAVSDPRAPGAWGRLRVFGTLQTDASQAVLQRRGLFESLLQLGSPGGQSLRRRILRSSKTANRLSTSYGVTPLNSLVHRALTVNARICLPPIHLELLEESQVYLRFMTWNSASLVRSGRLGER